MAKKIKKELGLNFKDLRCIICLEKGSQTRVDIACVTEGCAPGASGVGKGIFTLPSGLFKYEYNSLPRGLKQFYKKKSSETDIYEYMY